MPSPILGPTGLPLVIGTPPKPAVADDACDCCEDAAPVNAECLCRNITKPGSFSFTLSTITNQSPLYVWVGAPCNNCDAINQTYVMDFEGSNSSGCIWEFCHPFPATVLCDYVFPHGFFAASLLINFLPTGVDEYRVDWLLHVGGQTYGNCTAFDLGSSMDYFYGTSDVDVIIPPGGSYDCNQVKTLDFISAYAEVCAGRPPSITITPSP